MDVIKKNSGVEEIENHIDDFKQVINRERQLSYAKQGIINRSGEKSSHNKISNPQDDKNDKIEAFLKEMSDTEQQIKMLKIYNKSFNKEMSERFGGYDFHSDDSYEIKDSKESNSSEGDLSREEAKDKVRKFKPVELSPKTVIQNIHKAKSEIIHSEQKRNDDVNSNQNDLKNLWKKHSQREHSESVFEKKLYKK